MSTRQKTQAVGDQGEVLGALYALLLNQRRIKRADVAAEMGIPRPHVDYLISDIRRGHASEERLLRLDHAVTAITDQRGGVYAAAGTTEAGRSEYHRLQIEDLMS